MSPLFAYMMVFLLYLMVAGVVLGLSLVLALFPKTRQLALEIAAGMAASFPGVFFYQIVAGPILFIIGLVALLLIRVSLTGAWHDVAATGCAIVVWLGGFFAASLYGFIEGWLIGRRLAKRTPLLRAVKESWTYRLVEHSLLSRLKNSRQIHPC